MGYAGDKFDTDQLRYSTGVALFWASPLGPLKVSVGFPLRTRPLDVEQRFQFTIGGVF
jgi:outer membrane protein insertion porin family